MAMSSQKAAHYSTFFEEQIDNNQTTNVYTSI